MASNARTDDPQRAILECIQDFIAKHCYPPTITEICQIVGLRSKGTAAVHLRKLRDLGLLTWQPGQERTFVITDAAWAALEVVKAWLNTTGSERRRSRRRRLMRDLMRRPDVRAAIEEMMALRGISHRDAFALMSAQIEGGEQSVRLCNGKVIGIKASSRAQLAALRAYFQMTGFLPTCPHG